MTHKYVVEGWTVTLPAPGRRRFVGYNNNGLTGRFFGTYREAQAYRRECLRLIRSAELMPGDVRVVRATLTLTARESR